MESVFAYFDQLFPLSAESRRMVQRTFKEVHFSKGTILVTQGRPNPYFYLMKNGVARGFYTAGDKEVTSTLWHENEMFGDVTTYITSHLAVKSYQLLEDSILYRFNIADFRELFDVNYEICNLGRIMAEKHILGVEANRERYSGLSAREKYEFFISHRPGMIYRVRFIYIASYLKMAPETLSRIHTEHLKCKIQAATTTLNYF